MTYLKPKNEGELSSLTGLSEPGAGALAPARPELRGPR